jgi:hypothetical protein
MKEMSISLKKFNKKSGLVSKVGSQETEFTSDKQVESNLQISHQSGLMQRE